MSSNDYHAELVASMREAEIGEKNDETFFLVQLITAAALDQTPKYSVKDVYAALMEAGAWGLLDPLNLLPLLVPSTEDSAQELIQVIAREGNAKETIIYVQEALERLESSVRDGEQSNQEVIMQLTQLLAICRDSIPRLQLRRRRPAEMLQSILTHLGAAVEIVSPLATVDDGRNIINSVVSVIQSTLPWLSGNTQADDPHNHTAKTLLLDLLYVTLTACETHIHASLAQRRFEMYNPRLVIRTNVDSNSERGQEVMGYVIDLSKMLGATPEVFTADRVSFGKLILLAHDDPMSFPMSTEYFQKLIPTITSSLQQNIAMDESLALLLVFMSASTHELPQEIVDPVAILLTPLASTHQHAPTRHVAFRTLAVLLSRAPPPVHLAHLSSLLTNSLFPQMRVAAVGLVKEAFLAATASIGNEPSLFESTTLIHALGPTLFRPDPPDLFGSPTKQSLKKFLESSEPARLTECLAFYYVLLKRDTANSTGICDRDMLRTVESGLLSPLRKALMTWLEDPSWLEDPHTLMPIASLETSLERVDAAVVLLR